MCFCAPVFVFLPIVPSVDGLDDVRLHQAGVLLTLPSPSGPTCAAVEGQKVGDTEMSALKGTGCCNRIII